MGETLNNNGIKATIIEIKEYSGEINPYGEQPKEDLMIELVVQVENSTDEEVFISKHDFDLYDSNGIQADSSMIVSGDMQTPIPPGKKAKGSIFFNLSSEKGTWQIYFRNISSDVWDYVIWEVPSL